MYLKDKREENDLCLLLFIYRFTTLILLAHRKWKYNIIPNPTCSKYTLRVAPFEMSSRKLSDYIRLHVVYIYIIF